MIAHLRPSALMDLTEEQLHATLDLLNPTDALLLRLAHPKHDFTLVPLGL